MTRTNDQYIEIKNLLLEQKALLNTLMMLFPSKMTVVQLAAITGKARQSLHEYLKVHFEPEKDYWFEGNKLVVSQETAMAILRLGSRS